MRGIGLKDQERRFCEEYLVDLNAKRAALRAGYAPGTANNAYRWVRTRSPVKPRVRAEIDRMMEERARRIGVDADQVVQALARIAFADAADEGVRTQERLRALELLGKHLGLFAENVRPQTERPVIVDV